MKHAVILASALALVAGIAMANQTAKAKKPATAKPAAVMKTHDLKGVFVSVDSTAKKITFKDEKGNRQTVAADTTAITEAKAFKNGDLVTLTCRDNDKGEHQAVSQIHTRKS